jgi:FixJ family two-component response regulator
MSQRKTIVAVVDDNAEMRSSLKSILSAFGYVIYTYESAEAFLEAASASKAECLVIDVQLGDISGVELARELQARDFNVPVIFITGSDDETFRSDALQIGCVAYLQKPFPSHSLIEAIVKATSPSSS